MNKSEILELPQASSSSIVHKFSHQPGSGNLVSIAASEFDKGLEEGMKFLPNIDKLIVNLKANNLSVASTCEQDDDLVTVESEGEEEAKDEAFMRFGSRGKKKSNIDNLDHLEGLNHKVCSTQKTQLEVMPCSMKCSLNMIIICKKFLN